MAQNPRIFGFRGRLLFGFLFGGGVILIILGFQEVFDTQFNIPDQHTLKLDPVDLFPRGGDSNINGYSTQFITNDIFSVYNTINGTVDVNLKNPQNIAQIVGIVLIDSGNIPDNQDQIKQNIKFYSDNHQLINDTIQQIPYHYILKFVVTPTKAEPYKCYLFLQTLDGVWIPYNDLALPTIEPASSYIQLKNSRIVEGLTWVIVGAIPVGLVTEYRIHSRIGQHFFDLEQSRREVDPE